MTEELAYKRAYELERQIGVAKDAQDWTLAHLCETEISNLLGYDYSY